MKLTIEPRKTTWVPFVDAVANLQVQWRARVEYLKRNARDALTWTARTRYVVTGLAGEHAIPSSQLVIVEDGIPLAVTQTVVSAVKDRFQSEEMDDPFVVLTDRLAGLRRADLAENRPARGLLERSWVEHIERSLRIENKTGKAVALALTVVDHPADELTFEGSDPAPTRTRAPEYVFDLALQPDEEVTLKILLRQARRESIRLPVEKVQVRPRGAEEAYENANEPIRQQMVQQAVEFQAVENTDDDT